MAKVLVTGISGFIAVHTAAKLLEAGYEVRGTLRTMSRQDEVRAMLTLAGVEDPSGAEFAYGDLSEDEGWVEATTGCDYVVHVASPTPAHRPDDADEMVQLAIDGLMKVYEAAQAAGVKRIVLTSASGAVLAGHKNHPQLFTEEDWTNLEAPIDPYQRSKTRAEQEAWKFCEANGIEMASILPVAVMGPVLGKDFSHSQRIIKNMLEGKMKSLLPMAFDHVDGRDVASLHVLALSRPEAAGQRYLATTGENITYQQQAQWLKEAFGERAAKVSTRVVPAWVIKFMSHFRADLKMPATFLGQNTACSPAKAKALGWDPIPAKDAIIATAQSMFDLGVIDTELDWAMH